MNKNFSGRERKHEERTRRLQEIADIEKAGGDTSYLKKYPHRPAKRKQVVRHPPRLNVHVPSQDVMWTANSDWLRNRFPHIRSDEEEVRREMALSDFIRRLVRQDGWPDWFQFKEQVIPEEKEELAPAPAGEVMEEEFSF